MAFVPKFFAMIIVVIFVCVIQTYSMPVEDSFSIFDLANQDEGFSYGLQDPEVQYYAVSKLRQRRQAGGRQGQNQRRNPGNHWPYKGYFN